MNILQTLQHLVTFPRTWWKRQKNELLRSTAVSNQGGAHTPFRPEPPRPRNDQRDFSDLDLFYIKQTLAIRTDPDPERRIQALLALNFDSMLKYAGIVDNGPDDHATQLFASFHNWDRPKATPQWPASVTTNKAAYQEFDDHATQLNAIEQGWG